MSRRLDDLERLCNKLERRFGRADALFLQAKTELDTQCASGQMAPSRHDWSKPYHAIIKGWRNVSLAQFRH